MRKLANIVRHLRTTSHYAIARRNDPELAEWVARNPQAAAQQWRPPPEEFDLHAELLALIADRVADHITVTVNTTPGVTRKQQPAPRFPRPVTEIDKARARADRQEELALDALVKRAQATYAAEHGKGG